MLNLFSGSAQSFDPPAGQPGTKAIPHDSPSIRGWASRVAALQRGPKNCADASSGEVTSGAAENALGPAMEKGVVSLGDGGNIVLDFSATITDGAGPDFAVFENGFSDGFLELAIVEVSSNGVDYFPFPCFSETQTSKQTGPFDTLDARNLQNLAGKYRAGFGTGFDLEVLRGTAGLDLNSVRFIRIRDVVGSLDAAFATKDALGRIINEPWPTPFESGGFDLDAVGVLHFGDSDLPVIWPSLLRPGESFFFVFPEGSGDLLLCSVRGEILMQLPGEKNQPFRLPECLRPGVYFLRSREKDKCGKILVQ